jgi:hypothetical protein
MLTAGQRATIAGEIANLRHGGDYVTGRPTEVGIPTSLPDPKPAVTLKEAATMMGVDRSLVSDAKRLKKEAPDLHEEVKKGKMTLHAAEKERKRRKPKSEKPSRPQPSRLQKRSRPDANGRPAYLSDFTHWVLRGPEVLDGCPEPSEFTAAALRGNAFFDTAMLRRIADFLFSVAENMEAVQAA